MRTSLGFLTTLLFLILSITGCVKDDHQERTEEELLLLKQYLLDKNYNIEPTASGLYYIEQVPGTGIQPELEDYVLVNFTASRLVGEVVFGTTIYEVAEEHELVSSSFLYGPLKLQAGFITPHGINEGVQKMKEGGKSRMIIPSSLGFGKYPVNSIPAYSSLIYDVELVKVIPDPVAYENELLTNYLVDNQMEQPPLESGLYYIETLEGTGTNPQNNNTVEILYSAYLLDGRMIASTGTTVKEIQLNGYLQNYLYNYYTVQGLRDAIKLMKPGGKATVIVPYTLGFGAQAADASTLGYKYPVPPYSTIVYNVELKSIK